MNRHLRLSVVALVFALALAAPAFGRAGTSGPPAGTNPSPASETLNGDSTTTGAPFSSTISCQSPTSGTLEYTISGLALGPYPGTFTETGTVTINEGAVSAFSASFTVSSGATTLTGTKSGPGALAGAGQCVENSSDFPAGTNFFVATSFEGTYDVTITGPSGTNRFSGSTQNSLNFTSGTFPSGGSQEVFESATEVPVAPGCPPRK
jgi:hypothetical protein